MREEMHQLIPRTYERMRQALGLSEQRLSLAAESADAGFWSLDAQSGAVWATDKTRDVNDTDFDVSLHIYFRDQAAHDAYQAHPERFHGRPPTPPRLPARVIRLRGSGTCWISAGSPSCRNSR